MEQSETEHDPKTDPRNRLAAGAFIGLWAVAGWYSQLTNEQIVSGDFGNDPGPGLLAKLVLTIMTGGSLILMAVGLYGLGRLRALPIQWSAIARQSVMPLLLAGSLIAYIPFIGTVGFLVGNIVFAAAWMLIFGRAELRRDLGRELAYIALGTLIGVGLMYFVFIYWIGVPLR